LTKKLLREIKFDIKLKRIQMLFYWHLILVFYVSNGVR